MGFAAGFQTGWNAVESYRERRDKNEIKDLQKESITNAKKDAEANIGPVIDQQKYDEVTGFSTPSSDQAKALAKQDLDFGADGIRATQAGLDSAPGWSPQDTRSRPEGAQSAADTLKQVGDSRRNELTLSALDTVTTTPLPFSEVIKGQPLPPKPDAAGSAAAAPAPLSLKLAGALAQTPSAAAAGKSTAPVVPQSSPSVKERPAAEAAIIDRPKQDWQDIYHKKYMPQVVSKLMEQGRVEEAMKFEDWSTSAAGKRYGADWMKAYMQLQSGDQHGAIASVQSLYNRQLPDGQYAVAVPGKDGNYTVSIYNEKTNQLVGKPITGTPDSIGKMALGAMTPDSVAKYYFGIKGEEAKQAAKKQEIEWQRDADIAKAAADNASKPPQQRKEIGPDGKTYWAEWDGAKYKLTDRQATSNDIAVAQLGLAELRDARAAAGAGQQRVIDDNKIDTINNNRAIHERIAKMTPGKDVVTDETTYTDRAGVKYVLKEVDGRLSLHPVAKRK